MASSARVVSISPSGDYPLAGTKAQMMLQEALEAALRDKGQSQRHVAAKLGYKSSVVISHMASGRVPIPVDRAADYARFLGMDETAFLLAVLEQRFPEIDFRRLLAARDAKGATKSKGDSVLLDELEALAGTRFDELPMSQIRVLREVVVDRDPKRRWLQPHEVGVIEMFRRSFPDGMTPAEHKKLKDFVDAL